MTITLPVRGEHHGVPVFTADIQSTFTGALTFAVGARDETPRSAGITHLVEHLVMKRVGKLSISHNASTEGDRVTFFARGRADAVADFLNRVAAAVRSFDEVSDEDVAEQHDVISAELGEGSNTTGLGPLLDRFGAATLGLMDLGCPAHGSLSRTFAREWVATWLHAGNAVFTFTGPVPAALDAPLPPARTLPVRQPIVPLPFRTTGWVAGNPGPSALSLVLETSDSTVASVAAWAIQRRLLDTLRTERHLVYSVVPFGSRIRPDALYAAYAIDPQPEDAIAAMTAALEAVRAMARDGLSADFMAELEDEWLHQVEESEVQLEYLLEESFRAVRYGLPPEPIDAIAPSKANAGDVSALIAASLDTLLVSLGAVDEADHTPESLTELWSLPMAQFPPQRYGLKSAPQLFKAFMSNDVTVLEPKWFKGARGQQVILDPDQITLTFEGGMIELAWADIVLAGSCHAHGHWDLTGRDGRGFVLDPAQWRGGPKIVKAISTHVAPGAHYPIDDEPARSAPVPA